MIEVLMRLLLLLPSLMMKMPPVTKATVSYFDAPLSMIGSYVCSHRGAVGGDKQIRGSTGARSRPKRACAGEGEPFPVERGALRGTDGAKFAIALLLSVDEAYY